MNRQWNGRGNLVKISVKWYNWWQTQGAPGSPPPHGNKAISWKYESLSSTGTPSPAGTNTTSTLSGRSHHVAPTTCSSCHTQCLILHLLPKSSPTGIRFPSVKSCFYLLPGFSSDDMKYIWQINSPYHIYCTALLSVRQQLSCLQLVYLLRQLIHPGCRLESGAAAWKFCFNYLCPVLSLGI